MGHTVLAVGHASNTDTGTLHYYSGSWPYHDRIPYSAEDHGRNFGLYSYLLDFPENRVHGYCRIEYGFVGCASLISLILKLTLTILRSVASVLLCETSKLSVTALTSKRSAQFSAM